MSAPRVASLIASATEIVAALGAADLLVARSHECDYPPAVAALPMVTKPKLDPTQPSAKIDGQVKDLLRQALSIYDVDGAQLQALAPDIILTQTQCEVCAVSLADVTAALGTWTGTVPRVVALAPNTLADVRDDIRRVADALGRPQAGDALVETLTARMQAVAAQAQTRPIRPRVACIEWIDPLMAAGNWVPELVAMAGGDNLFGVAGRHSPWMTWADLVGADPDVILVLPCGFDVARTRAEMPALTTRPGWHDLRAVQVRSVYLLDGNQYFNRPGPRLVDSLEILAEILHPEVFRFGHEGRGWVRL